VRQRHPSFRTSWGYAVPPGPRGTFPRSLARLHEWNTRTSWCLVPSGEWFGRFVAQRALAGEGSAGVARRAARQWLYVEISALAEGGGKPVVQQVEPVLVSLLNDLSPQQCVQGMGLEVATPEQ